MNTKDLIKGSPYIYYTQAIMCTVSYEGSIISSAFHDNLFIFVEFPRNNKYFSSYLAAPEVETNIHPCTKLWKVLYEAY